MALKVCSGSTLSRKGLRSGANSDSCLGGGRRVGDDGAFYSDIGWPSVDPELMIRMLLVGYRHGIRHERRLLKYPRAMTADHQLFQKVSPESNGLRATSNEP